MPTRKRAAPKPPTPDDLESVTDLGLLFDLLHLPNGTGKEVGDRSKISGEPARKKSRRKQKRTTASSAKTTDLKSLYAWNFWDFIPIVDVASVPPHAQHPSPQYRVPFSERPTVQSISEETEAMLRRYTNLFTKPTKAGPAAATIRLPADWRDERVTGPSLGTENVHFWFKELQSNLMGTIQEFKSAVQGVQADSRATSEPASQKRYTAQDLTFDFNWNVWRHRKYTLFKDRDDGHNELVRKLQGADFQGRVAFVERKTLENESPKYRATLTEGNGATKVFHFDPLLSEVKYDESIRAQARAETDVMEEWSPIWIEHQLDKVYKLSPSEALPHLEYFLAHVKDINGDNPLEPLVGRAGVKLDRVYLDGREDYYHWRDRYLLSPQDVIRNAINSNYQFEIRARPSGELNVERSFDPLIVILRCDDLTELKSGCNLDFPRVMQPFGTTPQPDIAYRMIPELWSKDRNLNNTAPATFIGEAKFDLGTDEQVLAQLAVSVHPNLLLMALYYLDHRKNANDPTPEWLFFFSIRYFVHGFIIYGHYLVWNIAEERFGFVMVPVTADFKSLQVVPAIMMNLRALSVLGSMKSHNVFVTEMLRRWEGTLREKYEELCKRALITVDMEAKDSLLHSSSPIQIT